MPSIRAPVTCEYSACRPMERSSEGAGRPPVLPNIVPVTKEFAFSASSALLIKDRLDTPIVPINRKIDRPVPARRLRYQNACRKGVLMPRNGQALGGRK
jgi:hypothetical protein